MDKKLITFSVVFIAVVSIAVNIILLHYRKPRVIVKTKPQVKVITKTIIKKVPTVAINEKKLAGWIYQHSYRCSRKQAFMYAKYILLQPHPLLIASIIANESSFNPTAVSKANAIGLMQVLPTKDHVNQLKKAGIIKDVRDLFEPDTNIRAGSFLFNDMLKLNKNDITKTLQMYVGGSSSYVRKVLETLGQLTIQVKDD